MSDYAIAAPLLQHPRANRTLTLQRQGQPLHIGYEWIAAQRRSIGLRVTAEGLQVRAPRHLSQTQLHASLQARAQWIITQLSEQQRHAPQPLPAWGDGAYVAWRGRWLRLALGLATRQPVVQTLPHTQPLRPQTRRSGAAAIADALAAGAISAEAAETVQHVLHLPLPTHAAPQRIAVALEQWLRQQALTHLRQGCAHYGPRMGVSPTRLALTNAHARWGSASSQGSIRLHWRLVQMDEALFDYVLVHELAHLHEMNHSPSFWAHVAHILPDYAARRARLRAMALEDWLST